MNPLYFSQSKTPISEIPPHFAHNPMDDFVWLDFIREEIAAAPEAWQTQIQAQTGVLIDDYHLADVLNTQHPSAFDLTNDYQILIFRKLITSAHSDWAHAQALSPAQLRTMPIAFILTERVLITVRDANSPVFDAQLQKIKSIQSQTTHKNKSIPTSPIDLSLRLLNALIDKYLELRVPLNTQINQWQNQLLQQKKRFTQWTQLLQENLALQQLENLCEEQIDALQEFRDDYIDNQFNDDAPSTQRRDLMLVRINDLIEHASRVQKHALRLESALGSAVDLHFSASANQTNDTMRFLAILTAIFAPMTLLTGIYGMNFDFIPGLHNPRGIWFLVGAMVLTTIALLIYFQRKNVVNTSDKSIAQLLSGDMNV